jgi:hypothetical protein
MGYLQQVPADLIGQSHQSQMTHLLNKIGLPVVHRLPSIHRLASQGKLP